MNRFIKYCLAVAVALGFQVPAFAQASLEEVIVTAQRTEQSLQDVPIAVTALGADDLIERQVITFSDLQINVPSLQFGQGQYADSSISLRGIGALAVGLSYDGSVGYHINETPIPTSAIGDENFDVARIEVLRGPQGTLYGRGSTGGAVNVVTNMPDFDEQYGRVKVTAGNYNTQKLEGMFNLPINENFAVRFSGYGLKRDGFIDNLFLPDTHYDNRDQGAGRMILAFQNGDTSASLMYQQYNENSHRSRKGDFICTASATPDRGCILGGKGKDSPNPAGTYDGMIGAYLVGIAPPGGNTQAYIDAGLLSGTAIRPTGMNRQQTHSDVEPVWETDADVVSFEISQQFDLGELSFSATAYDSTHYSRADTDMTVGPRIGCVGPLGTYVVNEAGACASSASEALGVVQMFDLVAGGARGVRGPTIAEEIYGGSQANGTGIYQSKYLRQQTNRTTFINGDSREAQNRYYEVKWASDLDGPHNFLIGANYMEGEAVTRFLTASSPLTQLAAVAGYYTPTFGPLSSFSMQAQGIFGEYYYQINDDMKLTVGARWADETKDSDTIDASYSTGIDYAGGAYSGAAFNVGNELRTRHGVAADQAFVVDFAVHNACLNRDLLQTNGSSNATLAALEGGMKLGLTSACAASTSTREAIDREEVRNGVDYDAAINTATQAYVVAWHGVVDTLAGNNTARENSPGYIAAAGGQAAYDAMNETAKLVVDAGYATAVNVAKYADLVYAAGQVPSMYAIDSGYLNKGWPAYLQDKFDYETVAGRVVFDWQYDDNSMMYASYARGVKPGGINAAANPRTFKPCAAGESGGVTWAAGPAATCIDVPPQTKKEVVDTFEIGVKTDLMDGQMRLNATAFFSDYTDLQIASTINASEFNFNSDAEIMGAEIEVTYLPEAYPNLRLDFMANFLDTEITSADSKLNPFNKLAIGMPEDISATHAMVSCNILIFDGTDACIGTRFIVEKTALAAELAAGTYTNGKHATKASHEMWVEDLGTLSSASNSATILSYPSYGDRNYYDADSYKLVTGFMDIETSGGANVSIKGNSLPQAPEESFSLAASYTYNTGNGMTLIPTISYYYQSEMFNSEFNSTLSDEIDSWDEVNLGLTVIPAQGDWTMRAYVRNATDEDNVTTKFNSTDITGNYQTWQYRDPRTVGLELTMDF